MKTLITTWQKRIDRKTKEWDHYKIFGPSYMAIRTAGEVFVLKECLKELKQRIGKKL